MQGLVCSIMILAVLATTVVVLLISEHDNVD